MRPSSLLDGFIQYHHNIDRPSSKERQFSPHFGLSSELYRLTEVKPLAKNGPNP